MNNLSFDQLNEQMRHLVEVDIKTRSYDFFTLNDEFHKAYVGCQPTPIDQVV